MVTLNVALMEVRRMGPTDEALWVATVAAMGDAAAADAGAFLADPDIVALSALDDGRPVGWAWGHRLRRPDGRWMLLLYEIDVVAEHRRRGVGTALVERMKQIGEDDDCVEMWLVTEADNEAALALYAATAGSWEDGPDRVVAWELGSN